MRIRTRANVRYRAEPFQLRIGERDVISLDMPSTIQLPLDIGYLGTTICEVARL
jgi:hypothetical protein